MAAGAAVIALINADKYMVLIVGLIAHGMKAVELFVRVKNESQSSYTDRKVLQDYSAWPCVL